MYYSLFLNSKLDAKRGNPTIRKKALDKLIELKESFDLCDIWRISNMVVSRFAFIQAGFTTFSSQTF